MSGAATGQPGKAGKKASKPVRKKLTPKQKKRRKFMYIGGAAAALIALVTWYGMQPIKGTIHVGICRTFAELQVRYPKTLRLVETEQFGRAFRIYYVYAGAFGETRSDMMECKFIQNPATGALSLESVELNRMPVDRAKVEAFNKTIPAVIAAKPDLVLPVYSEELVDLKKD